MLFSIDLTYISDVLGCHVDNRIVLT